MANDKPKDAVALLKADHRKVEDLFAKFARAKSADARRKLAEQICNELKVHATIEEELFYPALDGKIENTILTEAYVEHDGAKVLINDILASDPQDEYYDAKVTVLAEDIRHHVKEEEGRGGMFAQARKTDVDLRALGEQMMVRKAQLLPQAKTNSLPPAQLATLLTA